MYRIVKNELVKIFSKKSLYVILIIAFLIIGFDMIFSEEPERTLDNPYGNNYSAAVDTKSRADLSTDLGKLDYVSAQTQIDIYNMVIEKYGINSWQEYVTIKIDNSKIYNMLYNYKFIENKEKYNDENKASLEITEDKNIAKEEYNKVIELFDSDNWREVANILKDDFEKQASESERQDSTILLQIEEINMRLKYNINFGYDYLNIAIDDYKLAKMNLVDYKNDENLPYKEKLLKNDLKEQLRVSEYIIKTKKDINSQNTARNRISNVFSAENQQVFIVFICIILLSGIVSDEYNKGTIKKLLVKPYKRNKILIGKFISSIIIMLFVTLFVVISVAIISCIKYGIDSLSLPTIIYNFTTDSIIEMNLLSYLGLQFLMKLPMFVGVIIILMFLSTVFGSSLITMAMGFLIYFGGNIITDNSEMLSEIAKLLPNCNWDFSIYAFGKLPQIEGITLEFSAIVCVIYYLILMIPTYIWFTNGDIKNK